MRPRTRSAFRPSRLRGGWGCALALTVLGAVSCGDQKEVISPTHPVPVLQSLSPTGAVYGDAAFTLTLTGSGFVSGSVVKWDGAERATSRVSDTVLHAAILASDLTPPAEPGDRIVQVWVSSPAPGGGTSNALAFQLSALPSLPGITSLQPAAFGVGDPDTTLQVEGHGFRSGSQVRWNGDALATEFVSSEQLSAEVAAARLDHSAEVTITVFNPPPGSGESGPFALAVAPPNPVPVLAALEPDHVTIVPDPSDMPLTLTGSGFLPASRILWDVSELPAVYVNDSTLVTWLLPGHLRAAGTFPVAVWNPPPGGGASGTLDFTIRNPLPAVTRVSPGAYVSSQAGAELHVEGEGFVAASSVRWNGQDRPTTLEWSGRLRATLLTTDLAAAGTAQVSVFNPPPGGGTSAALVIPIYLGIALAANDIVYDAATDRIYASVGSQGGEQANTITAIDPHSGNIVSAVYVGSEPTKLARSDDGQYIYVALEGSAKVRRYRIADATPDLEFALGTSGAGPMYAEDIAVLPGFPGTIVVSTKNVSQSPRHEGVFMYDDGVRRAEGTQGHTGSNRIEATEDPGILFGYNNESTEYGLRRLSVDASGIHEDEVHERVISGWSDIFYTGYTGGMILSTHGTAVDAQTLSLRGQMNIPWSGVAVGVVEDRAFFLTEEAIEVFDLDTFTPLGSIPTVGGPGSHGYLVQVDEDALAVSVSGVGIAILRHALVAGDTPHQER